MSQPTLAELLATVNALAARVESLESELAAVRAEHPHWHEHDVEPGDEPRVARRGGDHAHLLQGGPGEEQDPGTEA